MGNDYTVHYPREMHTGETGCLLSISISMGGELEGQVVLLGCLIAWHLVPQPPTGRMRNLSRNMRIIELEGISDLVREFVGFNNVLQRINSLKIEGQLAEY